MVQLQSQKSDYCSYLLCLVGIVRISCRPALPETRYSDILASYGAVPKLEVRSVNDVFVMGPEMVVLPAGPVPFTDMNDEQTLSHWCIFSSCTSDSRSVHHSCR